MIVIYLFITSNAFLLTGLLLFIKKLFNSPHDVSLPESTFELEGNQFEFYNATLLQLASRYPPQNALVFLLPSLKREDIRNSYVRKSRINITW